MSKMFFGQYNHSLDEKSRVRIPAKFKTELSSKFVITKGTNHCLFVFSEGYYQNQFLDNLSHIPTFDANGQKAIRALLSSSYDAVEDNQGRFLLSSTLKDFASIKKDVVFIGVGNRIEIWAKEVWDKYNDDQDFDQVTENLSRFNI